MQFYGFHGLLPEENKLGQRFNVDVVLFVDLKKAGVSDDMEDSVHYGHAYELVKGIVEGEAKHLIEAVAESTAEKLLHSFDLLEAVQVKVIKPDPPIPGHYNSVAVEIYREKNMNKAYVALGTNIEPRDEYLTDALRLLAKHQAIVIGKKSSIYETAPVGYTNQADFLNMVIEIDTSLSSIELLDFCQSIEKQLGRKRDIRFGPRTIDLDILLYNQENSNVDRLIIPHPRMHERAFVLIPLREIAPYIELPTWNKHVTDFIDKLPETEIKDVRKWTQSESEKG